jgi:outer membrane protein assembly factor BamB
VSATAAAGGPTATSTTGTAPGTRSAAPVGAGNPASGASGPGWASVDPANPLLGSAASTTAPAGTGGTTTAGSPFPGGLLIADRANGRLLIVSGTGRILWRFPGPGGLPRGQAFSADDAFLSPDGRAIVANDEAHQVIDRIDIATRRIVWQYGRYGVAGPAIGSLNTPDDSYPLTNGDIVVADIRNCRILEIAPDKSIVRQWGRTGVCVDHAPQTFGMPNGDTPLPDGGILITEITGSRVVRLSATGAVVFDVHVPVKYPSDAQLDENGNVVVADYASPGAVVSVSPQGRLLWRYGPTSGSGRLDHPSLATPLPGGLVSVNDDGRQRVVVIDPRTSRIVWQYGKTDAGGRGPGLLSDPDGHEPLPPGFHI